MRYLAILCIILTTVMSVTVTANGKCERPLARTESCECKPKSAGLLNLADGKLRVCDGTEWKIVQFTTSLGSSSDNPGDSCKHILDNDKQAADGVYWITLTYKREAFPVYCDMANGGWTMVFKAVSGAKGVAYENYKSAETYAEDEMAALDVTNSYPNDYKNRIVLNWDKFGASEARVVLYKGTESVKELKFNVRGSNNVDWFKFERLTEYPWNDMATVPRNLFTIEEAAWKRSFFINSVYAGCGGDVGWMLITGFPCDWEKHFGEHSVIYSNVPGRTNWNHYGNIDKADTMVVFLR